jgi:hypothetical protein
VVGGQTEPGLTQTREQNPDETDSAMSTATNTATAPETIEQVFRPIQQFTRGWMLTKETGAYGKSIGLRSGRDFWIVGRAGVLGDCTAETASAVLAFHAHEIVAEAWSNLPDDLPPPVVSEHYLGRIVSWGDETLSDFAPEALEAIDSLGRRIADAAPSSLGAVFAGWRSMPQPDGLGARVALTTHVLREMRGAAHLMAIMAHGLTPVEAVLANTNKPPRTGVPYAEQMGFKGPFRDPEEVREPRLAAEVTTAKMLEPFFDVLSPTELATFGHAVETTRNAIDM